MIARRALGLAAASAPLASSLRAADPARIAVVLSGTPQTHDVFLAAFRRGLAVARVVEGRDVVLDIHYLEGDLSRVPTLAEAIVRGHPRIIVVTSTPVILGLRKATTTVPIVMVTSSDPIGTGLAASLARPGGNVTGLSNQSFDLIERQLALTMEMLPHARRVLGLGGAASQTESEFLRIATRLGIAGRAFVIEDRLDFDRMRAAIAANRPDALFVLSDPVAVAQRRMIVAISEEAKLPVIGPFREFAELGGLASYGTNLIASWERSAGFVDRILKGANPAEMPIEQPTRFELIINLKTARALGLTIPASVLAAADEVIE
ncbi:MAG: ABC transporter substrate-binding protein [Alphaproteobacteria bacterium]|nr:ABC transporter substrate-binding protein [Alphaproteobacteria bacterium]